MTNQCRLKAPLNQRLLSNRQPGAPLPSSITRPRFKLLPGSTEQSNCPMSHDTSPPNQPSSARNDPATARKRAAHCCEQRHANGHTTHETPPGGRPHGRSPMIHARRFPAVDTVHPTSCGPSRRGTELANARRGIRHTDRHRRPPPLPWPPAPRRPQPRWTAARLGSGSRIRCLGTAGGSAGAGGGQEPVTDTSRGSGARGTTPSPRTRAHAHTGSRIRMYTPALGP